MSKSIKFKNNTFLDSSSIMHNRKTLNNILNLRGIAKRDGSDDSRIQCRSAWYEEKYTNLTAFSTSNSNVFVDSGDGGIKVKEAGWYIISGTINADFNSTSASIVILTSMGHHQISDIGVASGMYNMNMVATAFYLNANTTIWLGYRINNGDTSYLTRGSRSSMTVVAI